MYTFIENRLLRSICTLVSLLLLTGTLPVHAQPPTPVTIPKPGSLTVAANPKIPALNLPCKLSTGEDRPFPCEFRLDRIVFYKNSVVLGQVTPASGTITLPYAKVSQSSPAATTAILVNVRFFFTRINPPNFPEVNLLLTQINHSPTNELYKPADGALYTVTNVPSGQQFQSVLVPLVWPIKYNGEKELQFSAELYAYLPTTSTKLKAKYGPTLPLKDQSEASMLLNLKLTYD